MTDSLSDILERIASDEYSEADITALQQALQGEERRTLLQLGKYNIIIGEGKDIHIGDRTYVSWSDQAIRALIQAIQAAVPQAGSELTAQDRLAKLKRLQAKSRASCIARFRVAVANREQAIALAEDLSLGLPPESLNMKPGNVLCLTGELGIGKTLIAQRLFQTALVLAIDDPEAPIPVYLESGQWQKDGPLEELISAETLGLGELALQGATIFLDGLDEVDAKLATQILNEAYFLVEAWPKTTVVITSRPIPCIENLEDQAKVQVPQLSEQQVYELIERISGQKVIAMTVSN